MWEYILLVGLPLYLFALSVAGVFWAKAELKPRFWAENKSDRFETIIYSILPLATGAISLFAILFNSGVELPDWAFLTLTLGFIIEFLLYIFVGLFMLFEIISLILDGRLTGRETITYVCTLIVPYILFITLIAILIWS